MTLFKPYCLYRFLSHHTEKTSIKTDRQTEPISVPSKGVASTRQDEAIASSCFRRRQIFAHLFHDKANVNFN